MNHRDPQAVARATKDPKLNPAVSRALYSTTKLDHPCGPAISHAHLPRPTGQRVCSGWGGVNYKRESSFYSLQNSPLRTAEHQAKVWSVRRG